MKTLFINLGVKTIYGATRSLSELTKRWPEKFDMIFPLDFPDDFPIPRKKQELILEARNSYGKNLENVYFFWIPSLFPINVEYRNTLKWKVKHSIIYMLGLFSRRKVYKLIEKQNYGFIHLNSVTLYPLLSSKYVMYIHVREVVDRYQRIVSKHLEKARGVIFIDRATETPFCFNKSNLNSIVLINPFDMSGVSTVNKQEVKKQYGIAENEVVFMIAGNVSSEKGIDFVIEAFCETCVKGKLLIVGSGDEKYIEKCKRVSRNDSRIIFCGEKRDMLPLYRICDYVIRGDKIFGFGRTNYEALFSGKNVITPGDEKDAEKVYEYDEYKKYIFLYKPRDKDELKKTINICGSREMVCGEIINTSDEYVGKFISFVKK